mgnify:CR=1 FL=1
MKSKTHKINNNNDNTYNENINNDNDNSNLISNFVDDVDVVVGGADYNHIDQFLLPEEYRNYSTKYWEKRVMAPSSLLFYIGVGKELPNLLHHVVFFDEDFGFSLFCAIES